MEVPRSKKCQFATVYHISGANATLVYLKTADREIGISRTVRTCHSEPVRTLVWESPPSSRLHSPKDGDCHASVRYFIAMTWNSGVGIPAVQQAAFQNTCHSEPNVTKLA